MKIQPIVSQGRFVVQKRKQAQKNIERPFPSPSTDSVSFSASIAKYLKKYNTLPEEIKRILTPKDAIDMFKNMEYIQKGKISGVKIGQGNYARVYENPWLEGYYSLIVQDPRQTSQVVYSRYTLGDAIWSDSENQLIQIIKKPQTT